jgi:superfamily II DNA or RNA helicase
MQSTSTMSGVSFRKELRRGQIRALEHPKVLTGQALNIKLPTGYGKTYTACGVYAIRQHHQLASRLLYLVPSRSQLEQFISSAPQELANAGVSGSRAVMDIGFFADHEVLKRHRQNTRQIFAATIQYFYQGGFNVCRELVEQGQWMLCIDEYHHYGTDKAWGQRAKQLPVNFVLAMSATPYRPREDSAFGPPDVAVTYREAVAEGAVKPLRGHAYNYRIDAVLEDGNIKTYTTEELIEEVGSDSPESIERFRVQRKMRWSPKYVSPLTYIPITRMETARRTSGHKLQALVSAMCVSHAELVCNQIRGNFPHLACEWVGTGQNGRSDEDNEKIIKRFCPPKPSNPLERRPDPEIDVLVHVGMAGEGLDVTNVSEIVLLRAASFNNSTFQIIGRGARFISDTTCNVNFDGSTDFARGEKLDNGDVISGVGKALEYAMDYAPVLDTADDDDEDDDDKLPPDLPDEPNIRIENMELTNINSGDEGVQTMARVMEATGGPRLDYEGIQHDQQHKDWNVVVEFYLKMRAVMANDYNEKSKVAQWQDSVNGAVSNVTGIVVALMRGADIRIEKSLIGDIKKRINQRKRAACGPVAADIETCKKHYDWTLALAKELRATKKIPPWLM